MSRLSTKTTAERYTEAVVKMEDTIIKLDAATTAFRKVLRLLKHREVAVAATTTPPTTPPTP